LLGAHRLDGGGAVVHRREFHLEASGLFQLLDEAAIFALQLFHTLDISDRETDGFGGGGGRQQAGGECEAGKPGVDLHACRSFVTELSLQRFMTLS